MPASLSTDPGPSRATVQARPESGRKRLRRFTPIAPPDCIVYTRGGMGIPAGGAERSRRRMSAEIHEQASSHSGAEGPGRMPGTGTGRHAVISVA